MFVPVAPVVSAALFWMRTKRFVAELVAQNQKLNVLVLLAGGAGERFCEITLPKVLPKVVH